MKLEAYVDACGIETMRKIKRIELGGRERKREKFNYILYTNRPKV